MSFCILRLFRSVTKPVNRFQNFSGVGQIYFGRTNTFSSISKDENKTNKEKYNIFRDEDAQVILDVEEEKKNISIQKKVDNKVKEIDVKRGVTGVFDIEELVKLLYKDNGQDICVIRVPPKLKYVDYIVMVTGKSKRQLISLAEHIKKAYKNKRHQSERVPSIEGENSAHWIALDLGNIALHIMSKEARTKFDLESLWAIGAKYDEQLQQSDDPVMQILKKHSLSLDEFQPAQSTF